jgi:hypothetical protein
MIVNRGLDEIESDMIIDKRQVGTSSTIATQGGTRGRTVHISTIDAEVARLNLTVGFIKADVEGMELPILRGAIKTLREQRPVLSIAIYHNEQILLVPEFIAEIGGYKLRFHTEEPSPDHVWKHCELRVFAGPDWINDCDS